MKQNRHNLYLPQMVRNLVLPLLSLALLIASGTVSAATINNMSAANIGEILLLVVTIGIALSVLIIVGLISWGRKQDAYFNSDEQGEQG